MKKFPTCRSKVLYHDREDLTKGLSLEVKLGLSWQVATSGWCGERRPQGGGWRAHTHPPHPWGHFPGTFHLKLHFSVIRIQLGIGSSIL